MACMCRGCEECLKAQMIFEADFKESGKGGELLPWFPEDY